MKRLIYPSHVALRMRQRSIEHRQIEVALQEPHITLPTLDKKRSRVMRKFGIKTLDVIYEERREYIVLVTAAWLGDEDRKVKPK